MEPINKYSVNESEHEILPNLLGLMTASEIDNEEFEGFKYAEAILIETLADDTQFDLEYLYEIHRNAFGHLYAFAGRLRTVNMSKGGFAFPPARFLPGAMADFEKEFLLPLNEFSPSEEILPALARMHAELLFIHPFREGNGRTSRLLTDIINIQHTGDPLDFGKLIANPKYITAVQLAGQGSYALMEELFLASAS